MAPMLPCQLPPSTPVRARRGSVGWPCAALEPACVQSTHPTFSHSAARRVGALHPPSDAHDSLPKCGGCIAPTLHSRTGGCRAPTLHSRTGGCIAPTLHSHTARRLPCRNGSEAQPGKTGNPPGYVFSVSFRASEASRVPARRDRRYPCPDDEISPLALVPARRDSVEMTSLREHAKQVRARN